MSREKTAIPDDLLQLSQRLEEWRSAHPPRSRLPETIWAAAVEMAQRHGLQRTTKALRIDYTRLKKRFAGRSAAAGTATAGVPGTVGLACEGAGGVCGGVGIRPRQDARRAERCGAGLGQLAA